MPDARLERTRRAYDRPTLHVRFPHSETVFRAVGDDALARFDAANAGWIRDADDDRRVRSAIDNARVAWDVTANVIEGDFWGV